MDLAVVAAVFPVIFVGELPDKTMFATLVMATRGRPRSVWLGSAAAFLVHVVIATTVGVVLFRVAPHRVVAWVVAAMFLAGAAYALHDARRDDAESLASHEEEVVERRVGSHPRAAATAFAVIFVAEFGDLTQILTANLAAHYHDALAVGIGAVAALWAVSALAVAGGQGLLRTVPVAAIRWVTVVVLGGLAGYAAWLAAR